ncbi:MbtH family NRPS accessory protein [Streptomyces sp. NPDC047017]|uniref:MbtH family NRPS accessory protein n=1 Tax=Streptomyces sp. NPDC047017 TaxID=3155024 RepID=UPI0033F99630
MTGTTGPFDAPAEEHDSHLVLAGGDGSLSLWPAWRAVPPGWHPVFGPAPHARCLDRIGAGRP